MRSFLSSVKLRSLDLWPAVLVLGASLSLSAGLTGCIIVDNSDPYPNNGGTNPPPPDKQLDVPMTVGITPNQKLEATPGDGVGVFVEYASGGKWHVWTSCDTNTSNTVCQFDVIARALDNGQIENVQGEDLEGKDAVDQDPESGEVYLSTTTSAEFDEMTFDVTPGARLELEVYFDGQPDARVFYWYGDNTLHRGGPTNPLAFKPLEP